MSPVPDISLNDGSTIPQLGFGVFQIKPDDTAAAVRSALEIGYRHIDTAEMYGNEKEVGQGIRDAGIARDQVYVTSKLNNGFHRPDDARRAFDATLTALASDYVDLFLIHWPLPTRYDGDFVSTWNVLEEFAARRPRPHHRRLELHPGPPRQAGSRIQHRTGGQPDRGAPLLRQRHRAGLRPGARHRHRGVVTDRPGSGPRRPGGHEYRCGTSESHRRRRCCAGTSSAATSCSRSRCRPAG